MCLAILKKAGATIPVDHLSNGWVSNPGGAGYGFVKNGKTESRKGFFKLREFMAAYNKDVEDNPDSPFLVHFRIPTYGAQDASNTHPFRIDNGLLIHNGSFTGTEAKSNTGSSDTALFASMFAKNLSFKFVQDHKKELEDAIGYNKVALLYDDKSYTIINEASGYWVDDVWYSNTSYKRYSQNNYGMYDFD